MDQRELHLQPLGICYRLYHFITKTLTSQALKTVTLGRAMHEADKVVRPEDGGGGKLPPTQGEEKNDPCMKGALATSLPPQAKPPKKMVSINDNVEEILPLKNGKKKRSRSFQKSRSMEMEEEEEPKPLRSILKVGSDLNDKSNPVC